MIQFGLPATRRSRRLLAMAQVRKTAYSNDKWVYSKSCPPKVKVGGGGNHRGRWHPGRSRGGGDPGEAGWGNLSPFRPNSFLLNPTTLSLTLFSLSTVPP